jgi:hypothetical protein
MAMTFYPMYIPIHYGGGDPKGTAIGLLITLGIGIVGFNYIMKPKFEMKIYRNHFNTNILNNDIRYKNNYPHVKSLKHYNIDSLQKKQYNISQKTPSYYGGVYLSNLSWDTFATIGKKDNIDQFVADCKESDVYTEIIYSYDNFFGREVQAKKKLYWYKNYVEELK